MRLCVAVAWAVLAAAGAVACNSGSSTSSTLPPVAATPIYTTDTFTGTVQVGSSDVKSFTVTISGTVTVTLVAAGPPPTISMGLLIGTPATAGSSTCLALTGGTFTLAAGTTPVTGTLTPAAYCVQIFDVGNQTGPVTYTLTVNHS